MKILVLASVLLLTACGTVQMDQRDQARVVQSMLKTINK